MYSDYSSSNEEEDGYEEPSKSLFTSEAYLTNATSILDQWKLSLQMSDMQYLRNEAPAIGSQANLFYSGHHVRVVGFVTVLKRCFVAILDQYAKLYKNQEQKGPENILPEIDRLDLQVREVAKYLQVVEANNSIIFYVNAYPDTDSTKQLYELVAAASIYCLDLETMWNLLLTPKMFRQEQGTYLYKANLAADAFTYKKETAMLWNKHAKVQKYLRDSQTQIITKNELFKRLQPIVNSTLKNSIKFKATAILKGSFYTQQDPKGLKQKFIRQSLSMYHSEGAQQAWDYQSYQDTCLAITEEVIKNPTELMDCFLFMEPESILFEDRRLIREFAQFFNMLLEDILKLGNLDNGNSLVLPKQFLGMVLDQHNCQLFLHLVINFQNSNKLVYSIDDPQLHSLFFNILNKLKKLYLSMSAPICLISTTMFTSVTNRFFIKSSQDISKQIIKVLPLMVEKLSSDEMPLKVVIEGQKIELVPLSRMEYLSIIFYYIEDCKQKGDDTYLQLPDFYPTDQPSALLYLESLKLKLKHHDPKQDKKQEYANILEECIVHYKVKPDFQWFKKTSYKNNIKEREAEFNLHKNIVQPWANGILQQMLNVRDDQTFTDLRTRFQNHEIGILDTVIPYLSYAIGYNSSALSTFNVPEEQLFTLLEEMRIILNQDLGDLSNLTMQEQRRLNQLHICLGFYNTKVTEAVESEIYFLIIQKIILPWIRMPYQKVGKHFKKQFKCFFADFIIKDLYFLVGEGILDYIMDQGIEQMEKGDIIEKLSFFHECLYKGPIKSKPLELNIDFLGRIISILHDGIDVDIIMMFLDIFIFFIDENEELDKIFSIEILLDTLISDEKRLLESLKQVEKKEPRKIRIFVKSLLTKISEIYEWHNIRTILKILKIYFAYRGNLTDNVQLKKLLYQSFSGIESKGRKSLKFHILPILKYLIALRNYVDDFQHKQYQSKCQIQWKNLDKEITNKNCNIRSIEREQTDSQKVHLWEIVSVFTEKLLNEIKTTVKVLQAKPQQSVPQGDNVMHMAVWVWRKLVHNCGTLEDFIIFSQDISIFLKDVPQNTKQNVKNCIIGKNMTNAIFKKIVNKLPMLKECAEEIIKTMKYQGSYQNEVTSQIIFKLILINSKYKSEEIENFIIDNIHRADPSSPIKIYQAYFVKSVKKDLQSVHQSLLSKVLIERSVTRKQVQRISSLFAKIQCLPLKKFEKVKLMKQGSNVEQENQDWETESEGKGSSSDIEENIYRKLASKDQQRIQQRNCNMSGQEDLRQNQMQLVELLTQKADSDSDKVEDSCDLESSREEVQSYDEEMYDEERPAILQIFYEQHMENDKKTYKQIMQIREQINVIVGNDYRSVQLFETFGLHREKFHQLHKKLSQLLKQISDPEIAKMVIRKFPLSLMQLFNQIGGENGVENQLLNLKAESLSQLILQLNKQRKSENKLPRFVSRNANSESEQGQSGYDSENEEYEDEQEEMEGEDSQLSGQSIEIDESDDLEEESGSEEEAGEDEESPTFGWKGDPEEMTIVQELCGNQMVSLDLPDLQAINNKIEAELTGNELDCEEIQKILEVALLQLFLLSPGELKFNKSAYFFYKEIFRSRELFKVFNNSFLMIMRITQKLDEKKKTEKLDHYLQQIGLSFKRAISSYVHMLLAFTQESEGEENKDYVLRIFGSSEHPGDMLPIADKILLHFDLPTQDNMLTILILYSKYKAKYIHQKIQNLLSVAFETISKCEQATKKSTDLSSNRAKILTTHIFNNSTSSNIWQELDGALKITISPSIMLKVCLPTYRAQLFWKLNQQLSKKHKGNENIQVESKQGNQMQSSEQKISGRPLPFRFQEKVAEHSLKLCEKQIKHYFFWNKTIISQIKAVEDPEKRRRSFEKIANCDKELIMLTELMMFHVKDLKDTYFNRSDKKVLIKIFALPRCIIEASFCYLQSLENWIRNWSSKSKIQYYFQKYKFGQFPFTKLEQPCNLILEFLDMPVFCTSKMKDIILPKVIKHEQSEERKRKDNNKMIETEQRAKKMSIAYDLPLIFKLPVIPEGSEGQPIFATRQCSFDMTFYQLKHNAILVEFHQEQGSDHGGMVRELMMGWEGEGVGEQYLFMGKILAISFSRSIPFGGRFDYAMAVAITNFSPDLQFFKQVEPNIYNSLKFILDCKTQEDFDDLSQRFVIARERYGAIREFSLKQGGQSIDLRLENKEEYVKLYMEKYFSVGREWELEELRVGFYTVVNRHYISIFHPLELMQKIRGEEINNYMKLKKKAKYEEGYTENSPIIKWLWEIVSKFSQVEMNQFVQFLTGAPKVSIYDPHFSFIVEKTYGENEQRLPVAHTCFNTLDLPEYKTKEILEKKLLQAIFEGNGNFGIL